MQNRQHSPSPTLPPKPKLNHRRPARDARARERTGARRDTTREPCGRVGVLTGSPGLGQTRHGVAPDGAPCKGGRRDLGPEATQGAPRSSRPIGGGCCRADCHSLRRLHPISRLSDPLWTTPRTKKGTVHFFKGLMLSTSHTTPLARGLLHRRTARDVRHSEWGGGEPYGHAKRRPSGSRSRARASGAVLRCCSWDSSGCHVPPCPGI